MTHTSGRPRPDDSHVLAGTPCVGYGNTEVDADNHGTGPNKFVNQV